MLKRTPYVSRKRKRTTYKQVRRYLPNIRTGGVIGLEYKFKSNNVQQVIAQDITGAAAMPLDATLTNIPRGDGASARTGCKVAITSIHVKGVIEFAATSFAGPGGGISPVARIMLVIDHQNNGLAAAQPADCYDNPSGTIHDVFTTRSIDNSKRYTVLRDMTLAKGPCGLTHDGANYVSQVVSVPFNIYHKFKKPLMIKYNDTAATGARADIRDNSIDLYCLAQDSASVITYRSRVRYVDP